MSSFHTHSVSGRLRVAVLLTALVLLVEAAAGVVSHSLALLADAGHVLADLGALGLAWFAVEQSRRPADSRRTYGYHRVGILATLVNALALVLVVLWVGYEAIQRLFHPQPVTGALVVAAAVVGIGVNGFIGLALRDAAGSLTVRAALLHVAGDLLAGVALVAGGAVILFTGQMAIDPLLSIAIALLIAWGAVRIVLEALNVLLEAAPPGMKLEAVEAEIGRSPGVESVHDLHVWMLAPEQVALSCHLVIEEQPLADAEHVVRDIERRLCDRFGIGHTTIQLEFCHPCVDETGHLAGEHNHPHPVRQGR